MPTSEIRLTAIVLSIFLGVLFTKPLEASGTLGYGSHLGMEVDVVSVEGLGTTHAKILTIHSRQNAKKYCLENEGNDSAACIEKEMAIPMNDVVIANCETREFTNFFGAKFRMEGKNKNNDNEIQAKFALRYISGRGAGQLADGSNASGYPVDMDIFRHLCPSALRGEEP